MKIIYEGIRVVIVDEFTLDEIKELNRIGKDVYIADGNIVVEDKGDQE